MTRRVDYVLLILDSDIIYVVEALLSNLSFNHIYHLNRITL